MAKSKSTAKNPLIGPNAVSTIDYCRDVLAFMAQATHTAASDSIDMGRSLVLQTVIEALSDVGQSVRDRGQPALEVVNS